MPSRDVLMLSCAMGDVVREGLPNCWCPGFAGKNLDRLAVPKAGPEMCEKTAASARVVLFSQQSGGNDSTSGSCQALLAVFGHLGESKD